MGVNPSPVFVKHAERMARLSKYAVRGGIVLTVFGAAGMCGKIASTANVQQKNEILWVDGAGILGGLVGGAAATMAVGLADATGPVGWGVALFASAVGGDYAQKSGKAVGKVLYDQYGQKLDLTSGTVIGRLCS